MAGCFGPDAGFEGFVCKLDCVVDVLGRSGIAAVVALVESLLLGLMKVQWTGLTEQIFRPWLDLLPVSFDGDQSAWFIQSKNMTALEI